MKKHLKAPKVRKKLSIFYVALSLVGCATQSDIKNIKFKNQTKTVPVETRTDNPPVSPVVPSETSPQEPQEITAKVALILGPGGYKTAAHIGVIKQLLQHRIPIEKIVGVEWAALPAALYAMHGKVNDAEWQMYKLEKSELEIQYGGIFSREMKAKKLSDLRNYFDIAFQKGQISQAQVPFACPTLDAEQSRIELVQSGAFSQAMEKCIPHPPQWQMNDRNVAALFSINAIVEQLKREKFNVIILVNALGKNSQEIAKSGSSSEAAAQLYWREVKQHLLQVNPGITDRIDVQTEGFGLWDYKSRNELVKQGEVAGQILAEELLSKYGF